MESLKTILFREQRQYRVFLFLSIIVMILTGTVYFTDNQPFARFIGGFNPILAALLIVVLGGFPFTATLSRKWFAIFKKENLKGLYWSAGIAAILGIVMILVDLKIRFPADMNILFPASFKGTVVMRVSR
jgi:hypothetical protein